MLKSLVLISMALILIMELPYPCYAAESCKINKYILFSPNAFSETSWLTIADTDADKSVTIEFIHTAQIVVGKNKLFIVDHLDHRQDRLLCLSFGSKSEGPIGTSDITSLVRSRFENPLDTMEMVIVKTAPLTLKVRTYSRSTSSFMESICKIDHPNDAIKAKDLSLIESISSNSLWDR